MALQLMTQTETRKMTRLKIIATGRHLIAIPREMLLKRAEDTESERECRERND